MATHELRVVLGNYDATNKCWMGPLQTRRLLTWTRPPGYGIEFVTVVIDHRRKGVSTVTTSPSLSHITAVERGREDESRSDRAPRA